MCYEVLRQKHKKTFRNSGGIAVFANEKCYTLFNIERLDSLSKNLLWLKFDLKPEYTRAKNGFNFICGFVYMSPEGSSIHSEEYLFYVIENEIASFKFLYPDHRFIVGGEIKSGSVLV